MISEKWNNLTHAQILPIFFLIWQKTDYVSVFCCCNFVALFRNCWIIGDLGSSFSNDAITSAMFVNVIITGASIVSGAYLISWLSIHGWIMVSRITKVVDKVPGFREMQLIRSGRWSYTMSPFGHARTVPWNLWKCARPFLKERERFERTFSTNAKEVY